MHTYRLILNPKSALLLLNPPTNQPNKTNNKNYNSMQNKGNQIKKKYVT